MKKILLLSPHSDDIALSIGGWIAKKIVRDYDCEMHTIFTFSKHGPYFYQSSSIEVITEQRILEDKLFCKQYGIEYHNAGFRETTVRGYPSIASIFQAETPFNDPLYDTVEKYIQELVISSDWDFVFAPAGIGNHVEHLIVREICKKNILERTIFYEDLPYANDFSNLELKNIIRSIDPQLFPVSYSFSEEDKIRAIQLYSSQIGEEEIEKVRAFAYRSRPEMKDPKSTDVLVTPTETLWGLEKIILKLKSFVCNDQN